MFGNKISFWILLITLISLLGAGCRASKDKPINETEPIGDVGDPAEIMGLTWYWIRLDDPAGLVQISIDNPTLYTLSLNPDRTYTVKADCNLSSGNYTIDGSSLGMASGPTTLAECGAESRSSTFLTELGQVVSFFVAENKLILTLGEEAGSLVFVPASLMSWPAEVNWTTAIEILNTGQVTEIMQTHSLEVTLTLEDKSQVLTIEPTIDLIFHQVTLCGELCGEILLITE